MVIRGGAGQAMAVTGLEGELEGQRRTYHILTRC